MIEQLGSPGWNANNLVPYVEYIHRQHNLMMTRYMLATETFIPPNNQQVAQGAAFDPSVHGTSGPVNVSFPVRLRTSLVLSNLIDFSRLQCAFPTHNPCTKLPCQLHSRVCKRVAISVRVLLAEASWHPPFGLSGSTR